MPEQQSSSAVRIGVLALQGSFAEHVSTLRRLPGVEAFEVRNKEQLLAADGLIIPGGESTTMALVAERWGLIPELRQFAKQQRPIWGTCAGLIFLADKATGTKRGGQALLGGLDCTVHRNFFGAQIHSFETDLEAPPCLSQEGPDTGPFRAVFIRAPAILDTGPSVQVLSEYHLTEAEQQAADGPKSVAVAVRCKELLATAFHPELTADLRWHMLFVDMVRQRPAAQDPSSRQGREAQQPLEDGHVQRPRPADLPIYDRKQASAI